MVERTIDLEGVALLDKQLENYNFTANNADNLIYTPSSNGEYTEGLAQIKIDAEGGNAPLWKSVSYYLNRQDVTSEDNPYAPFDFHTELWGVTDAGHLGFIGEDIVSTCPTSLTSERREFDLLGSACHSKFNISTATGTTGKITLNLPFRTDHYEELNLEMGTYSGWKRLKTVPVLGNAAATANIPVWITVPYDSDMNSDFSDIRFVDWDGNLLTYAVLNKTDSSTARFIIQLATTPETGATKNINVWYKKSDATSSSVDVNTLLDIYDLFNDSSINSNWVQTGGNGSWAETSVLTYYVAATTTLASSAVWANGTGYCNRLYRSLSGISNTNWTATVKVLYDNMANASAKGIYIGLNAGNSVRMEIGTSGAGIGVVLCTGTVSSTDYNYASRTFTNQEIWLRIKKWGSTYFFQYSPTGVEGSFITLYYTSTLGFTPSSLGLHGRNWSDSGTYHTIQARFSDFIVKKAMSYEPTIGNLSAEKQDVYGGTWTWQSILSDTLVPGTQQAKFTTPTFPDTNPLSHITYKTEGTGEIDGNSFRLKDAMILNQGYNSLDIYKSLILRFYAKCNSNFDISVDSVNAKYEI